MSGYEQDVDQALDLVAESEGPDQWAGDLTVPEVIETGRVQRSSRQAVTEAFGAAVREHERVQIVNRVLAWATAAQLTEEQWNIIDHVREVIRHG